MSTRGPTISLETFEALCLEQKLAKRYRWNDATSVCWQVGRQKVFAVWVSAGDQVGPHLRCNDEAVRGAGRVARSTLSNRPIEVKNNFLWLDPTAKWTEEELRGLVVASHALATRKDGGVTRGDELSALFIALRRGLKATPAELRPPPPFHAGGPAPKPLRNEGPSSRALAVWGARLLAEFVPAEERAAHARAMALAEAATAKYDALWAGSSEKGGSRALQAARLAKLAHGSMAGGYETRASSYAGDIAALVVEELLERGLHAKVTPFLAELDERLLNAEFAAVARERVGRELLEPERVLWRGTDAKGNAGRWFVRLGPGRYALLHKVGPRWTMVEGARDDVLANVPDAEFAAATTIAYPRDVPGVFGAGAVVRNPRWK